MDNLRYDYYYYDYWLPLIFAGIKESGYGGFSEIAKLTSYEWWCPVYLHYLFEVDRQLNDLAVWQIFIENRKNLSCFQCCINSSRISRSPNPSPSFCCRVVYPLPRSSGASAEVLIESYCTDGYTYEQATDSCQLWRTRYRLNVHYCIIPETMMARQTFLLLPLVEIIIRQWHLASSILE